MGLKRSFLGRRYFHISFYEDAVLKPSKDDNRKVFQESIRVIRWNFVTDKFIYLQVSFAVCDKVTYGKADLLSWVMILQDVLANVFNSIRFCSWFTMIVWWSSSNFQNNIFQFQKTIIYRQASKKPFVYVLI